MLEYSLEDVCLKITDGAHFSPKGVKNGYPMLSVKDMREYGFSYENCKYIEQCDYDKLVKQDCIPHKGDVLVAKDGSYLKHIFVCEEQKNEGVLSSIAIFRPNKEFISSEYLMYLLKSPSVFNDVKNNYVSGSALPRIVLKDFKKVKFRVHDRYIQNKIVDILSRLDEKIKLNNMINNNLEQQAVLLFRKWFTNFECVSENAIKTKFGTIPNTFKLLKNGELPMIVTDYVANGSFASLKANVTLYQEPNYAYFIRNTDLKSGTFEVFVDEHSYNFLSKSTLYGGEIIISNVGDVGSVFLCPKLNKPMTLGNNIIMLRPERANLQYYLYIWFKWLYGQSLIQGIKGGSAQPKFNKTDFKNLPIYLPPDDLLEHFHLSVKPMFELIAKNNTENQRLSALRDTLLPKLMSGELDVSEIDI